MAKRYRKEPIRRLTRDECLYLAGLFDGEGCFQIHTSVYRGAQKYSARIRLAMCHKPTIEWVARTLGVKVNKHGLGVKASAVAKPMYRVAIENLSGVVSLIDQLLPFMITKREAATVLMAFARARLSSGYFIGSRERSYTPNEVSLYGQLRVLNSSGVKSSK